MSKWGGCPGTRVGTLYPILQYDRADHLPGQVGPLRWPHVVSTHQGRSRDRCALLLQG